MRALILLACSCFSFACFAQKRDIIDGCIIFQYTKTIDDLTKGNNPWGAGTGLQAWFNVGRWCRPIVEVTGHIYLEDDKIFRSGSNDEAMLKITTISKIFLGPALQVGTFANLSLATGTAFTGGNVYTTLKPSLHFFLNKKQSVFFKLSYIHIYDRGYMITEDFTSYAAAVD